MIHIHYIIIQYVSLSVALNSLLSGDVCYLEWLLNNTTGISLWSGILLMQLINQRAGYFTMDIK